MGRYNWFHHTYMINFFYQNLTLPLGVNSCLDMFLPKNILHGLLFPFRFYSDWEELKFPFDNRGIPCKLKIGKETNRQNSIFASLPGILTGSF